MKTTAELRSLFLDYFRQGGHAIVPSSSLVPINDPTLLFTNAGMVQFKDVFLGREKRPYTRAASCQRCVRAGGKHNDLENVGYTARHHTFFEMLGNFSFGDYFKREAIAFAWEFLTKVLELPPERLWVTVYEADDEAADIWLNALEVDPARFARCGAKDNFWSMGDTGPCGPCSEIFYDHGPEVAGGPPGSPNADGDRYVEIWNLVFMQYDRAADGKLAPLPRPSVDTGMGLERLAAVMQGVHSNYETDLFRHLIGEAARLAGKENLDSPSLRVIADHIRASAFLVSDGVLPSNEGRGYVLRRIIRRAIRHGAKLGVNEPFFYRLVEPLCAEMGDAYPELVAHQDPIERVLRQEEVRFAETLQYGLKVLEEKTAALGPGATIPGEVVFLLYDTYGFPIDLTADIARERGLRLDTEGFERAMERQRERARAASRFAVDHADRLESIAETEFTGYECLIEEVKVTALYQQGKWVEYLEAGQEGLVALDRTPFYAESGGQVGDRGVLRNAAALFEVQDTRRHGEMHGHLGQLKLGTLRVGDTVKAVVDAEARTSTARNHSATHLLHAALRSVLGTQVLQKGSLVAPDRLRFDFSYPEPVSRDKLSAVERLVNTWIRANAPVETHLMELGDALASGAVALFGEKYADRVRVLRMGEFSTELCGGTHVARTGDIGLMKIVSETGVAAGIRRVEALTDERAVEWIETLEQRLLHIAGWVKGGIDNVEDKVQQLVERQRKLEKELEHLRGKLTQAAGGDLTSRAVKIRDVFVLAENIGDADPKTLRETVDQVKNKLGSAVVVLASTRDSKVSIVAGVTKDRSEQIKAGELANWIAQRIGGKGGGRPDMAQGGGTEPAKLPEALRDVPGWVEQRL